MSQPLCKFGTADGAAKVLEFNTVFITSPLDLNDPFEMRPAWTNSHELEQFEERQIREQLTGGMFRAEPPIPVENQIGLSDHYNERVFQDLHERFRVLSLLPSVVDVEKNHTVSRPEDTLMWSHYGDHNQGICLVFDAEKFNNGLKKGGYPVEYHEKRKGMPAELYSAWKRLFEPRGEDMDQARHELLYRHYLEILTRKSPEWKYEGEVRMIYEKSALDGVQATRFQGHGKNASGSHCCRDFWGGFPDAVCRARPKNSREGSLRPYETLLGLSAFVRVSNALLPDRCRQHQGIPRSAH